jgi:hypothetical protein
MDELSVFISLAASALIVFTVIFVLVKNWRDRVMRYYALYSTCALGILFTMFLIYTFPSSFDLTQLNRITQASTLMTFAAFFALSFVFPKTGKGIPFWVLLLIMLPAIILGTFIIVTDFTVTRVYFKAGELMRDYNRRTSGYSIYAVITFGYLLSAIGNFIRKYIKTKVTIYRLQMRYVFLGQGASSFVSAFVAVILPLVFNYTGLYVIGPSLSVFFASGFLFYSIIAYNLSDITTVIHKTFVYLVISMIISIPIFGLVWAYNNGFWVFGDMPYYLIAAAVVAVFILVSVYIQPAIDRLFKRRQYAFGSIVDEFIMENDTVRELPDIVKRTVDLLHESLSLRHAFFILLNDQTRKYELYYYKGKQDQFQVPPIERNASVIRWFVRNQEILQLSRVYMDEKSFKEIQADIAEFFNANGIQVVLPIYHERRLIGLLCLGIKETLAGYHTDEINKLKYFSTKCNDFISSALTYQKAVKEQLVARTVEASSTILKNAIPQFLPNISSVRFGAYVLPKYREGSDYFDFIRPGNQGVGIITTDISGIGVNSALYAVLLRSAVQSSIDQAPSTSSMMLNLNSVLYGYSGGRGGLVTAFYLYYDIKSMRLMYTNAGYPPLEIFRLQRNSFDSLDTEGPPLGLSDEPSYGIARTDLGHGDIGVLYSKTITGSRNQKGDEFGLPRLRNIVMKFRTRTASDIATQIKSSFETFMGVSSPASDVVVIIFKIV